MEVEELKGKIPNELFESLAQRIKKLTPPQEIAIKKGLLDGKNIVVSSPTASGKTIIAEIALLNSILRKKGKGVYVAPMRALVREKFEEFSRNYPWLKIGISIGDYDSFDPYLKNLELIFVSTEKLDSLIRHGIDWVDEISTIVFDEIHLLDDFERGTTLEILITKLREMNKKMQIIALSATIGNAKDIASWLNAECVESDFRPVKLYKGVYYNGKIYFENSTEKIYAKEKSDEENIARYVLSKGKQVLFFYSSKRNAESAAKRISEITKKFIKEEEKEELKEISSRIKNALSSPTQQCISLSELVKKGAAFHHAGLLNQQRKEVEEGFKKGLIKVICSTTTLGFGVNLPANTVAICNLSRYDEGLGVQPLAINEVIQLLGRAGRPSYDTYGVALLFAKSKSRIEELKELLNSPPQPITSKLGYEPLLRSHVLALICSMLNTQEKITKFFEKTFFGFQYGSAEEIKDTISSIIQKLKKWKFVEEVNNHLFPTREGKRVNELYIDPLSARLMLNSIEKTKGRNYEEILFGAVNTFELKPFVSIKDEKRAIAKFYQFKELFDEEYEIDDPLKIVATTLMFEDWIDEVEEKKIVEEFLTTPGAFFSKLSNLDWMLYSYSELLKLRRLSTREALKLRIRVNYGIREELMELTTLEGIGRVRARKLFNIGIKTINQLKRALLQADERARIEKEIGKEITKKVELQILK
ncbi:MAG: DEAD/DEAH box helicase [Candidatus Micrarchaeales archaeon]